MTGVSQSRSDLFGNGIEKNVEYEWRKDLLMEVNNVRYRGIAIVPPAPLYDIKFYPPEKSIDRLQWNTCHRGDYADRAVQYGRWPWSKKESYFKMKFQPKSLELDRACPLNIVALTQRHKEMGFGMMIFPDPRPHIAIKSKVECNGSFIPSVGGTNGCQAPVDTIHKVHFDRTEGEVYQDVRENAKCPPMRKVGSNTFEFFMPKDLCVYLFVSRRKASNGKFKMHKFLTYGYEKIPPPKG